MSQRFLMLINVGAVCVAMPPTLVVFIKTALIDASKRGRLNEVKSLVENSNKACLTCTDEEGLTPLHLACRHGRKEVVTYLVSKSK